MKKGTAKNAKFLRKDPDTLRYGAGAKKKLCDLCDSFATFAVKKIKYEI